MSIERKKYCVNGEWKESKTDKWMPVTDSSTGEVIAEVPCCTVDEHLRKPASLRQLTARRSLPEGLTSMCRCTTVL